MKIKANWPELVRNKTYYRYYNKFIRRAEYYNLSVYEVIDNKLIRDCIQKRWDTRKEERELKKILNSGNVKKRGRL